MGAAGAAVEEPLRDQLAKNQPLQRGASRAGSVEDVEIRLRGPTWTDVLEQAGVAAEIESLLEVCHTLRLTRCLVFG
jgi:hypothetical protein